MGRVNIMFSPIPYAAVYGVDPVPNLDHIFYVSRLGHGTKQSDLQRVFDGASLGRTRLNLKSRGTQVCNCCSLGPKHSKDSFNLHAPSWLIAAAN